MMCPALLLPVGTVPPISIPNDGWESSQHAHDRNTSVKVRVLGCSGAIARDCRTTSFLVNHNILIDAGTGVGV